MTISGLVIGVAKGSRAGGGISPAGPAEFTQRINQDGHAVAYFSSKQPWAHRVAGDGIGHDDAAFSERGVSFAAYLENGEAFGGLRWWEDTDRAGLSYGVMHYGCEARSPYAGIPVGVRRTAASAKLARDAGIVDPHGTSVVWG